MGSLTTVRIVGSALVALAVMVPVNTTASSTPGAGGQVVTPAAAASRATREPRLFGQYKHVVVIYQENHSFDNLYGEWGKVGGQHGRRARRTPTPRTPRRSPRTATPYDCLLQNDVNLTSPPLPSHLRRPRARRRRQRTSRNEPFTIDDYIEPTDTTCPAPGVCAPNGVLKGTGLARRLHPRPGAPLLPGAVPDQRRPAEPLRHRLGRRRPDDGHLRHEGAADLPVPPRQGRARTTSIADHFFQGAFGGSFLNHQWLIAGRAPVDTKRRRHPGGRPTRSSTPTACRPRYPLVHRRPARVVGRPADRGLRRRRRPTNYAKACGNFAVNTVQPASPPFGGGAKIPLIDDAVYPNIGDRMSDAGISWNWYSGGWDDAERRPPRAAVPVPPPAVQLLRRLRAGQPGRAHLQDETKFFAAARGRHPAARSASSSRTARRTSTPATPASPTAATTSST